MAAPILISFYGKRKTENGKQDNEVRRIKPLDDG